MQYARAAASPPPTRRHLLALAAAATLTACQASPPQPTQLGVGQGEDEGLRYKFRGIGGGELLVDSTIRPRGQGYIVTYQPNGKVFRPLTAAAPGENVGVRMAFFGDEKSGGLPVPKSLRYMRWPRDAERNLEWRAAQYGDGFPKPYLGAPIVDVTVPVASRIPDAVLERLRKYRGSLTLKLRLTPRTILVGWQVRNGKNYPYPRDAQGDRIITDADLMIGGDFCEAQSFNEKVNGKWQLIHRKGWQIDPATGQRVETDF